MYNLPTKVIHQGGARGKRLRSRVLPYAFTFKVLDHPVSSVRFGMKPVIAHLIPDVKKNENKACQAYGKSGDIDE